MQEAAQAAPPAVSRQKPGRLSASQMFSLCCGLFGVQIAWGLQNANTSRIFQTLGARIDDLPILWIAGPIAGLLVQPLIGEWSDRTTGRWGRRRPFMAAGALLTAAALVVMAYAETVWTAAVALWLLTFSINVVMEPFRALMGDVAPADARDEGFSMQVLFIGAGAVFASILPWLFVHFGVSGASAQLGRMPPAVRASFDTGAAALLLTVMWTVVSTREPAPSPVERGPEKGRPSDSGQRSRTMKRGAAWVSFAIAIAIANAAWAHHREIYLLAASLGVFGALHWLTARSRIEGSNPINAIADEVIGMPKAMRRLAVVQFFTWFALFALWVYAVPAVAQRFYGNPVPGSLAYESAANWVGMLFAAYNGLAAVIAIALPAAIAVLGRRRTHAICLAAAALGFVTFVTAPTPAWLWLSVLAIAFGWASILAIPYAIVAASVPPERMGVYMGIHNIFLVLPQLAGAALLGPVVRLSHDGNVGGALFVAGAALLIGAVFTLTIPAVD